MSFHLYNLIKWMARIFFIKEFKAFPLILLAPGSLKPPEHSCRWKYTEEASGRWIPPPTALSNGEPLDSALEIQSLLANEFVFLVCYCSRIRGEMGQNLRKEGRRQPRLHNQ